MSSCKKESPIIKQLSDKVGGFTVSIHYDRRLYKQDIKGSIVHAAMLCKQKIITLADRDAIQNGLTEIEVEIETGSFIWKPELEDIHMNIESRLHEKIGPIAGKLHTARSRNDQVSLDMRMFVKESIDTVISQLTTLQRILLDLSSKYQDVIVPGYTHLQKAQPVLFAHHLLAYFQMFDRDKTRFREASQRTDVLPLGSGALAGLPYDLDRNYVAEELGFSNISANSMDAVSDRDFVIDYLSAASICMMHISRFSEELILWTTEEFSLIKLPPEYTTGSSIMPQKRNPDFAEISRGKTGRVYGNLVSMLTILKGLPMTYNRDLQEDKEGFFDSHDTLTAVLEVFTGMLPGIYVNSDNARQSAEGGMVLATDLADYLVAKGVPFREAHGIISNLSDYASSLDKMFGEISLEEYRKFSPIFEEDVYEVTVESSINARNTIGGTSFNMVQQAIERGYEQLKESDD